MGEVRRSVPISSALKAIQAASLKMKIRKKSATSCFGIGVVLTPTVINRIKAVKVAGIAIYKNFNFR